MSLYRQLNGCTCHCPPLHHAASRLLSACASGFTTAPHDAIKLTATTYCTQGRAYFESCVCDAVDGGVHLSPIRHVHPRSACNHTLAFAVHFRVCTAASNQKQRVPHEALSTVCAFDSGRTVRQESDHSRTGLLATLTVGEPAGFT